MYNLQSQEQYYSTEQKKIQWLNFHDQPNDVTALADGGDYLWVATYAGLIKLEKPTGNKMFIDKQVFNKEKGILPSNDISHLLSYKKNVLWVLFNYYSLNDDSIKNKPFLGKLENSKWKFYTQTDIPGFEENIHKYGYFKNAVLDSSGILWIAVENGLIKVDNEKMTFYTKANSGLPGDEILDLTCDSKGTLWLYIKEGVIKFEDEKFELFKFKNLKIEEEYPGDKFVIDNKGRFLFFLIDYKEDEFTPCVLRWDLDDWELFTSHGKEQIDKRNLTFDNIDKCVFDKNGNLYIAKSGHAQVNHILDGLYQFDGKKVEDLKGGHISSLICDDSNTIWFGEMTYSVIGYYIMKEGMLWMYKNNKLSDIKLSESPTQYNAVATLKNKGIWAATYNGLAQLKNGAWKYYKDEFKIFEDGNKPEMKIDNNDNLYFYAYDEGLVKFDGEKWEHINLPAGCESGEIYHDRKDGLFVKCAVEPVKGIYKLENDSWKLLTSTGSDSLYKYISNISFDLNNNITALINDGGWKGNTYVFDNYLLAVYKDNNWMIYNNPSDYNLSSNLILFDHENNYWMQSKDGIVMFDGVNWKLMVGKKGNDKPELNSIFNDSLGNSWLCTTYGLLKYRDGVLTEMSGEYLLLGDRINCMNVDKNGIYWIGTMGEGIIKFDAKNNKFENYNIYNSHLLSDYVGSIEVDNNNNKFFIIPEGISVFNENGIRWK